MYLGHFVPRPVYSAECALANPDFTNTICVNGVLSAHPTEKEYQRALREWKQVKDTPAAWWQICCLKPKAPDPARSKGWANFNNVLDLFFLLLDVYQLSAFVTIPSAYVCKVLACRAVHFKERCYTVFSTACTVYTLNDKQFVLHPRQVLEL